MVPPLPPLSFCTLPVVELTWCLFPCSLPVSVSMAAGCICLTVRQVSAAHLFLNTMSPPTTTVPSRLS